MRFTLSLIAMFPASVAHGEPGSANDPANDWNALKAALRRCWQPPSGTDESFVTYRFSLTKEGGLRGKPLTTGKHLTGDEAAGKSFLESGAKIFETCLPIPVTASFGAQFGLRTIRLTLVNGPPRPARNLNNAITLFAKD